MVGFTDSRARRSPWHLPLLPVANWQAGPLPSASPLSDIVSVAEIWIIGGRPVTSSGLIYSGRIKSRQGLKQSWDSLNQTLGGKFCMRAETTTHVASLTDIAAAAAQPHKKTQSHKLTVESVSRWPVCFALERWMCQTAECRSFWDHRRVQQG